MTEKEKMEILATVEKIRWGTILLKVEDAKIVMVEITKKLKYPR
jgi:hypothetical protein